MCVFVLCVCGFCFGCVLCGLVGFGGGFCCCGELMCFLSGELVFCGFGYSVFAVCFQHVQKCHSGTGH